MSWFKERNKSLWPTGNIFHKPSITPAANYGAWRYWWSVLMALSKICQSSCRGRFANRRGCSVGVVSNKTPSHSQLLQIIKGHHMSLLMLSWQMTWLESKYETDESRAKKYFTGTRNWVGDPDGRQSAVTDSQTAIIIEQKVKVVEKRFWRVK